MAGLSQTNIDDAQHSKRDDDDTNAMTTTSYDTHDAGRGDAAQVRNVVLDLILRAARERNDRLGLSPGQA